MLKTILAMRPRGHLVDLAHATITEKFNNASNMEKLRWSKITRDVSNEKAQFRYFYARQMGVSVRFTSQSNTQHYINQEDHALFSTFCFYNGQVYDGLSRDTKTNVEKTNLVKSRLELLDNFVGASTGNFINVNTRTKDTGIIGLIDQLITFNTSRNTISGTNLYSVLKLMDFQRDVNLVSVGDMKVEGRTNTYPGQMIIDGHKMDKVLLADLQQYASFVVKMVVKTLTTITVNYHMLEQIHRMFPSNIWSRTSYGRVRSSRFEMLNHGKVWKRGIVTTCQDRNQFTHHVWMEDDHVILDKDESVSVVSKCNFFAEAFTSVWFKNRGWFFDSKPHVIKVTEGKVTLQNNDGLNQWRYNRMVDVVVMHKFIQVPLEPVVDGLALIHYHGNYPIIFSSLEQLPDDHCGGVLDIQSDVCTISEASYALSLTAESILARDVDESIQEFIISTAMKHNTTKLLRHCIGKLKPCTCLLKYSSSHEFLLSWGRVIYTMGIQSTDEFKAQTAIVDYGLLTLQTLTDEVGNNHGLDVIGPHEYTGDPITVICTFLSGDDNDPEDYFEKYCAVKFNDMSSMMFAILYMDNSQRKSLITELFHDLIIDIDDCMEEGYTVLQVGDVIKLRSSNPTIPSTSNSSVVPSASWYDDV